MENSDVGTLRWFGASWDAPVNDPRAQVLTPVWMKCTECGEAILSKDRGVTIPSSDGTTVAEVAFHLDCFFDELGIPHE